MKSIEVVNKRVVEVAPEETEGELGAAGHEFEGNEASIRDEGKDQTNFIPNWVIASAFIFLIFVILVFFIK